MGLRAADPYRTTEAPTVENVHSLYNNVRVTLLPLEIKRIAASATFAIAFLMLATHAWAQAAAASVGVVTGTCTVERAGKSIQAADGTPLIVGDKLTTGPNSRMTIGLGDGSQLDLVHTSPGSAPNFEVHTPNAVASARGTMFDVSYHEGQPPPATP
jgi:hypothetical protein